MHVLVSTTATQGEDPDDFCYVPEGELVARYGMVCDDEGPGKPGCGCGRSFGGLTTRRSTTTAIVADLDMTRAEWRAAVFRVLADAGYATYLSADELADTVDDIEAEDLEAVQHLPVGTVVGRCAWNIPQPMRREPDSAMMHDHLVYRRLPATTGG